MPIRGTLVAALLTAVAACGTSEARQQPPPSQSSASPTAPAPDHAVDPEHDPMPGRTYTADTDRAVIAYLDKYEPYQRALMATFQDLRDRTGAVQRASSPDAAAKTDVCKRIATTLDDDASWRTANPLPPALGDDQLNDYQGALTQRILAGDKASDAVLQRVATFASTEGSGLGVAGLLDSLRKFVADLSC